MKSFLCFLLSAWTATAAVQLNGTTQFLGTSGTTTNLGAPNYTVSCWFYRTTVGTTANTGSGGFLGVPLVAKGAAQAEGSNVDANYFLGIITTNNRLAADFEDAGTGLNHPVYGTAGTVRSNFWHHAVLRRTSNTFEVYLDGRLDGIITRTNVARFDSIQKFGIGASQTSAGVPAGSFGGQIAEVAVWNVALDPLEIYKLAQGKGITYLPLQMRPGSLLGYWPLDGPNGGTVTPQRDLGRGNNWTFGSNAPIFRSAMWSGGDFVLSPNPQQPAGFAAQPPVGEPMDRLGTNSITVVASGTAPITYQWKHQGTNIADNAVYSGTTTATLTISGGTEPESGAYVCTVANAFGSANSVTSYVTIYHSTDAGVVTPGNIAVLGDREGGFNSTRANAVDNIITNDLTITNMITVGDNAGTVTYSVNQAILTAITNRGGNIFPTMGNHDYDSTNESYTSVFFTGVGTNNNGGRVWYSQRIRDVEFFFWDSNTEPGSTNGNGISGSVSSQQSSPAGIWMLNAISTSTAPWKIFMAHHPAYCDGTAGGNAAMRWDFTDRGIHTFIQGHAHGVERIYTNRIYHYTAALGGASHQGWSTKFAQTEFRIEDTSTNGYMRIGSSPSNMVFEYFGTGGELLDRTVMFKLP